MQTQDEARANALYPGGERLILGLAIGGRPRRIAVVEGLRIPIPCREVTVEVNPAAVQTRARDHSIEIESRDQGQIERERKGGEETLIEPPRGSDSFALIPMHPSEDEDLRAAVFPAKRRDR